MKIFVLINSMSSGGAERVVANLVNKWANLGCDVCVATIESAEKDFYELDERINRVSLNCANESKNLVEGFLGNLKRISAVKRSLNEYKPDIIMGVMTTANILLGLAYSGDKKKIIATEHIYPPNMPLGFLWEGLRKIVYPRLGCVVMLTSEGLVWLNKKIPGANGMVMPNPIVYPLAKLEPNLVPSEVVVAGRNIVVSVGRLEHQKGFDYLIDAFCLVAKKNSNWDLYILGDGSLRSDLNSMIQSKGMENRIFLLGRVGNVGDWYECADVCVMSSRFEGFPNTLGEAMSYGCPVVSYDCDTGPRDIIRDGLDGILVNPVGDVKKLSEAINCIILDKNKRTLIGRNAISVRERYSIDNLASSWIKLFNRFKQ